MKHYFFSDNRLGISLPSFDSDWGELSPEIQQSILLHWEKVKGEIPDRIAHLEEMINIKQAHLSEEEDFRISCHLNNEISEIASVINDLWIWYRKDQDITQKMHI
jgi:hypothetical protein